MPKATHLLPALETLFVLLGCSCCCSWCYLHWMQNDV